MKFSGLTNIASFFYSSLGRNLYFVFALAALSAIIESFGISMLIPLIENFKINGENLILKSSNQGNNSLLFSAFTWLSDIFRTLSISSPIISFFTIVMIVFCLKSLFLFSAQALMLNMKKKLRQSLKMQLFEHITSLNYLAFISESIGHFSNLVNEQVDRCLSCFVSLANLIARTASASAYIIIALVLSWKFGVSAIVLGMLFVLFFKKLNVYIRLKSRAYAQKSGFLSNLFIEVFRGFKYFKSTASFPKLKGSINHRVDELADLDMRMGYAHAFTHSIREPIALVFIGLVVGGNYLLFDVHLTELLVATILFYRALGGLFEVQLLFQKVVETSGSVDHLRNLKLNINTKLETSGTKFHSQFTDGIHLKNLDFKYPDAKTYLFKSINLTIPANKTVALVGSSGAGKSTIADILCCLLPPKTGQIFVDNEMLSDLDVESWRQKIGYVSQDPIILNGSVLFNITLEHDNESSATPYELKRVSEVCKLAHIHDVVTTLPDRYNAQLGDSGARFSGGQRQRLSLARELYRNPSLLILDEATSALDAETEDIVSKSINALKGKVTILIIAHKMTTISKADSFLFIKDGHLHAIDSLQELLEHLS